MKVSTLGAALLLASSCFSSAAQEAPHPPHWGYSGEVGPEHWAQFESDFGACSDGRNQSPIDLAGFVNAELPPIAFDYRPGGHEVVNNGHAIQVNYKPGSNIAVDGNRFDLKQFHFHSPSENTINGKSFPMEAHFVHADAKGNLAVVALMFEEGKDNAVLAKIWPQVKADIHEEETLAPEVDANALLDANRDYYRYNGSLTTPPCTEGVRWFVLKQPATASAKQLGVVPQAIGHANNRPVQPLGARAILE